MSGSRIGYYKTLKLGDVIRGPEGLKVSGRPVEMVPGTWALRTSPQESGAGAFYTVRVLVHLIRGYTAPESTDVFMGRKIAFAKSVMAARGVFPSLAYSGAGPLAFLPDDANVLRSGGPVSAGSSVTISITGTAPGTLAAGTRCFITDGTNAEIFSAAAGSYTTTLVAQTLAYSYAGSATVFVCGWCIDGAYLTGDLDMPASQDSVELSRAKDISLEFQSVNDPVSNY